MKHLLLMSLLLVCSLLFSQNVSFKREHYVWSTAKPVQTAIAKEFMDEDVVIMNEEVKFNLITRTVQSLQKNCILKINTENGVKKLQSISLPESFDIGADKNWAQQGRMTLTQAPFIYDFKIMHFAVRVLKKSGEVIELPINVKYNKVFWLEGGGDKFEDFNYIFSLENVQVGDVVEYNYEIQFLGKYGLNLFFFNGDIPKQHLEFQIKYSPVKQFEGNQIVYNGNVADSLLTMSVEPGKNAAIWTYQYKFDNLPSMNYPVNSCSDKNLPYIFIDLNFLSFLGFSTTPNSALVYKDRGPHFEWMPLRNLYVETVSYDKQHASIRKFLSYLPHDVTAEDQTVFLTKLCDTLNTLKYVSAESMNMSGNAQYAVSSGEWLLKGKVIEEFMFDVYWQLLGESKISKNALCVQDKRLGENRIDARTAYKYEHFLYAIENGKSLLYMMPRVNGLKYNLNEIPFYFEGVTAGVMNYDIEGIEQQALVSPKLISFIKTSTTTEDENVRAENGVFKINLDSMFVNASIRENLNGQFSTIIRPFYANETIDSTVNPIYFKKCTNKPNAKNVLIKKTSSSNVFPFKNSFSCTEKISFATANDIPLANWFSFTFNKKLIQQKPNFDYYFDFQYTDIYNYVLEFNKATVITNETDFNKSIQNTYFDLSSKLIKQSETTYLLSVMVKVKEPILLKEDGKLLIDFVEELDVLNHFAIKIKP
jgi:hypothetical protein